MTNIKFALNRAKFILKKKKTFRNGLDFKKFELDSNWISRVQKNFGLDVNLAKSNPVQPIYTTNFDFKNN